MVTPHQIKKLFPWGELFATRENFEAGYFTEESRLVEKYLKAPGNVLIMGSGNGREARPICHDGHRIVCTDLGVIYLQVGKRLFKSEGVHTVRFVAADTSNGLPFRKEHFDFVFFSYYSSCGGHRFDLMHDIHRVMRPGAFLLLCSCTPLYPKQRPSRNFDHWIWIENADQLRQEISVCGFGLIESETDPERPEYRFSMLRSLKGE